MVKNGSESAPTKAQTPEVKKPITNEERLAAVKKQVDDKTRKDAIEK